MSGLSLQVYDSPSQASMLADWTSRLSGELSVMNNEHGYGSLSGFVPMDIDEAFSFYNRDAMPHVILGDGAFHVFEGRLEDTAVTSGGLAFTAFGYWRAYGDTLYTELWSDDSVTGFTWMKDQSLAGNDPATVRYVWNNDNEIYMAPRKGESFRSTDRGMFKYSIPDKSTREIVAIDFDYDVDLVSGADGWDFALSSRDAALGSVTGVWLISGFAGSASVSITFPLTPAAVLTFELSPSAAGPITHTASTGAVFASVTNVRIKTTDAATIDASTIVSDLVASVAAINPSQVQSSTSQVQSMGIDLTNEVYEDARPQAIINKFISLGDDSTPPQLYEAAVWENRYLAFRQRGSAGREWAIDASDLSIKRTVDGLGNVVYAVYNSPSGNNLRTATATDDPSVGAYDLVRQLFTVAPSTTDTNPEAFRDALLRDSANPKPETSITFSRVADKFGALYELYFMRAGDAVLILNLPPTAGDAVDRIRKFIIHRVGRYDPVSNSITIMPEKDAQSLPVLVARNSESL